MIMTLEAALPIPASGGQCRQLHFKHASWLPTQTATLLGGVGGGGGVVVPGGPSPLSQE